MAALYTGAFWRRRGNAHVDYVVSKAWPIEKEDVVQEVAEWRKNHGPKDGKEAPSAWTQGEVNHIKEWQQTRNPHQKELDLRHLGVGTGESICLPSSLINVCYFGNHP